MSSADLERVFAMTEGWATGLSLAALALTRHPETETLISGLSASRRLAAEYLLDEVLRQLPPEVRDWLLEISVLT